MTTTRRSFRSFRTSPVVLLLSQAALFGAGGLAGGCTAEFEAECPEGTVQQGGGDAEKACVPAAGAGGAAGSEAGGPSGGPGGPGGRGGSGGSGGSSSGGSSGSGGGVPVPAGQECAAGTSKCTEAGQQTCSAEGTWGAAVGCDIACDEQGSKCVVPVQVAAGTSTCARLSDGTVRCWGADLNGALGNGPGGDSVRPSEVPGLQSSVDISSNINNTCVLLGDKTARCWGGNSFNQIAASGDTVQSPTPVGGAGVKRISDGGSHLCVLSEDGKVQCRGSNSFGQLGDGTTNDSILFKSVQGFSSTPSDVQAASTHSCALLSDGTVSCWGAGDYRNGSSNEDLTLPTKVPGVSDVTQLSLGATLSCALRKDGVVLCWGSDFYGNLGRGALVSGASQKPGPVINLGSVKAVSAGVTHVCAVREDKTMWCWGSNRSGQLGGECGQVGTCKNLPSDGTPYIASPTKVPLENVEEPIAGYDFSCARTGDNKLYCWGKNDAGQLGLNKVSDHESAPSAVVWK